MTAESNRWVIAKHFTPNATRFLSKATTRHIYIWDTISTAMSWSTEREALAVIERISGSTFTPHRAADYRAMPYSEALDTKVDNGR